MKRAFDDKILLGIIAVLLALVYWHTFSWLVSKWINDGDYSHGFLIPVISGYVVWTKRNILKELPANSSKWGLPVFMFGLIMEIASVRANVSFTSGYSFIVVLLGLVLFFWGKEAAKELLFPILFLFFMIPFFQFLIDPISYKLKLLSTYLSTEATRLMGIPLFREGVIISLARGKMEVADPCSGIRSLMTFLMAGTMFAYFANGPMFKKITLFFVTIPLVVFANAIRIVAAILLLHFQGIIISNTHWETALGIMVFTMLISGLLLTGKVLKCQL